MGKLASLNELEDLGLNTPRLLLALGAAEEARSKVIAWNNLKLSNRAKVSIRTENVNHGCLCPHHPNITQGKADAIIRDLVKRPGYEILIFEGIDPNDCLRRGNIVVPKDLQKGIIVEYSEGPGTVRDLNRSDFKVLEIPWMAVIPDEVRPIVLTYATHRDKLVGRILEWSIYRNPVGKLKRNEIFWEIRPWQ